MAGFGFAILIPKYHNFSKNNSFFAVMGSFLKFSLLESSPDRV